LYLPSLDAVSAKDDESKLSKVAKGVARILICIVAAMILILCIILNLIISLIPFLIFQAINKDAFNQESIDKNSQDQVINEVKVHSSKEYNECVEEEVNKLWQQSNMEQGQLDDQSLMRSDNQPVVEVISRVVDKQVVDQTITAKNINNDGIRDGEMIMRVTGDDNNLTP